MKIKNIVIRNEYKLNEYRTPLVPDDCRKLIESGINIYVEKSLSRCIPEKEYEENGCIIINDFTNNESLDTFDAQTTLIIGLKELDYNNSKLFPYCHLYFTHLFKNQSNSLEKLIKLKESKAIIYDYEYFVDENNKRLIAFGYWAGLIGTALGLLQYYNKSINKNISNLSPYSDAKLLIEELEYYKYFFRNLNIGIIGINGRCGQGAKYILDKLGIKKIYGYSRDSNMSNLKEHHIIINCIQLKSEDNNIFISNELLPTFNNLSIIIDISCDVFAINNPIRILYTTTTFEVPIQKINDKVDIIAIDNLPSLLPNDSSKEFSNKLFTLLQKWDNFIPNLF